MKVFITGRPEKPSQPFYHCFLPLLLEVAALKIHQGEWQSVSCEYGTSEVQTGKLRDSIFPQL